MNKGRILYYILAVIMSFATFSGILILPSVIYFVCIGVFFVLTLLTNGPKVKFSRSLYFLLLTICIFSILYNQPLPVFRAWERFIAFFLILIAFSSFVSSCALEKARLMMFDGLMRIILVFSVSSFFAYFLGINFFVRMGEQLDMADIGHFSGFFNHSMVLGPMAAIACIYCLSKALLGVSRRKMFVWYSLCFFCFAASLFSASRTTAGALFVGMLMSVYQLSKLRAKKFGKYIGVILLLGVITFPVLVMLLGGVLAKNSGNIAHGGILYSRESILACRLYEIKNNPLTGVGFVCVDPIFAPSDNNGTIEPGSSWLAVFSMTGIFGLITMLLIYIKAMKQACNINNNEFAVLALSGILCFFGIHMVMEGYIFAAGNIMCGLFWLTIGVIYSLKRVPYKF